MLLDTDFFGGGSGVGIQGLAHSKHSTPCATCPARLIGIKIDEIELPRTREGHNSSWYVK